MLRKKHSYADTLCQGWRVFLRARAKLSINFEEILSRAHVNFEEQNMVLESSMTFIIIVDYFLLLMYIIIILYNYCVV